MITIKRYILATVVYNHPLKSRWLIMGLNNSNTRIDFQYVHMSYTNPSRKTIRETERNYARWRKRMNQLVLIKRDSIFIFKQNKLQTHNE